MHKHLMNTYSRLPVAFRYGRGCRLYDTEGREYLDGLSGIAVSTLGYNHPRLSSELSRQVSDLIHCSNIYQIEKQEELARTLCAISGLQEVFFCNSGCEANEAAIKIARLYGHSKGIEAPTIIVMEQAFHGRTMATLSATGNRKVQAGFEPLVGGFARVPYKDLAAVEAAAVNNPNVVAVMLEIIQGEGGINIASPEYVRGLHALCQQNDWLLICDEVQCGTGRTGRWFGFQHAEVIPDIVTLAKGLGSGVPIGACLTAGKSAGLCAPGNHGSTFGGNPLACTAALTTIDVIEQEDLIAHAERLGEVISNGLNLGLADVAQVVDIRGMGLMIGIELEKPCGSLVKQALDAGLLINVTANKVVRLLPPLIISEAEALELVRRLSELIKRHLEN